MKSLYASITIFMLMVCLMQFYSKTINDISQNLQSDLDMCISALNQSDWEQTQQYVEIMRKNYENYRFKMAMVVSNVETEGLSTLLATLAIYVKYQDLSEAFATIEQLSTLLQNLPKRDSLSIENIL